MSALSVILALAMPAVVLFSLLQFPAVDGREISSFGVSDSPWNTCNNLTLVSPNGTFAAGFVRRSAAGFVRQSAACGRLPSASGDGNAFAVWVARAAGMTVVWSLNCSGGAALAVDRAGTLSLGGAVVANYSGGGVAELKLGEDGRLAFGSDWSSFDSPNDTVLAGQGFRQRWTLTSRNGRYHFVNATVLLLGTDRYWDTQSPLKNLSADGTMTKENGDTIVAADIGEERLRRVTIDDDGNLRMYSLESGNWTKVWELVTETCKIHGTCGENAVCYNNGSTSASTCSCLPGFEWDNAGGGGDCRRKTKLLPKKSKLLRLDFVDFPDDTKLAQGSLPWKECSSRCSGNDSCLAFTYKYTGDQACALVVGGLVNAFWSPATETSTFLRVADQERDSSNFTGMFSVLETVCPARIELPVPPKERRTTARNLSIIGSAFALELLVGVLSFWALLRRYSQYRYMAQALGLELLPAGGPKRFSYAELKAATAGFSKEVGRGGFGVVYRGELPDGRVVAVKQLKDAAGSEADFWAEANIIARMHHLNLVRLWGFCADKGHRMLVYEFVPNGSLDKHLFQGTPELGWAARYRIAVGVARAIAYLHEECLEWVLHRDIKPENILLDGDLCPKVSDFGLAKFTREKERDWFTRSAGMRGTQGYMAPEWIRPNEPITAKADVYSFGMVLLEMVTGARNNQLCSPPEMLSSSSEGEREQMQSEEWYLPGFVYQKACVEGRAEDLVDPRLRESYDSREHLGMVERMLKTAMWCLQERPEMRPSMGKVAKMLEGSVEITEPGRPTIFFLRYP